MSFMSLHDVEANLIAALLRQSVKFMVVGGRAVQYHGHLRAAKDLDIWYCHEGDNPKGLLSALTSLGINRPELTEAYLAKPNVQLHLNGMYHAELLSRLEGVAFADAYTERVSHSTKGTIVPVISRRCLIQNKRALARPQDLEDVKALEANGLSSRRHR